MTATPVLDVVGLVQHFPINRSVTIRAVDGIDFSVDAGEVFGIVGETGSGKSTVAKSILGVNAITGGEIYFKGNLISAKHLPKEVKDDVHRNMQIIFQDSAAALNPHMTVEDIVAEPLLVNRVYAAKEEREERVLACLAQVGLSAVYRHKYPGELSGGMRQRVAIARSIAIRPDLIIADEPIASLDISIQAQIVTLFQHLQKTEGFSFIFIAHDLSMVRFLSTRIAVMLKGKIVELAPTDELFRHPLHPYTASLISSAPVPDPDLERSRSRLAYDTSLFTGEGVLTEVADGHFLLM
ncbi:MAG: ABC transporter ATP-binding protein [Methanocorpusculum sp.]|nr:ABC transporter ATP-binding protein [Methanocorpusculum sp.]